MPAIRLAKQPRISRYSASGDGEGRGEGNFCSVGEEKPWIEVRFAWEWRGVDWKDFERVERILFIYFSFFRERERELNSWGYRMNENLSDKFYFSVEMINGRFEIFKKIKRFFEIY